MNINDHIESAEQMQYRHSGEIHEIITKVPSWIIRWGITIFFAILIMAVGASIAIKYPDTIRGKLKIESSEIVQSSKSPVYGRISKVLLSQGAAVKAGQPLLYVTGVEKNSKQVPLVAMQDGIVEYAAIVQQGSILQAGQDVFTLHPLNEQFFGVMELPSILIKKVKIGQAVGVTGNKLSTVNVDKLNGTVSYITGEPTKAGTFLIKVSLPNNTTNLQSWMDVDAEITISDVTILQRILRNVIKATGQ